MVIELSGVQFGQKSYAWFQIEQARSTSLIWIHKYDFRPKLHDLKFNCHFIRYILKSHNLIAQFAKQCPQFVFHFPAMWLVSLKKLWNLIGCFVLLSKSHWLRKRCDLEQKIVQFTNKSNRWEPITLLG